MSDTQTKAIPTETEQLIAENVQLKEDLRHKHDLYLRNAADFDNYRKRVERDRVQESQAGKRKLILALLDVMDDFERALAHVSLEPQPVIDGLRASYRRLAALLAAEGVISFKSLGQPFDPTRHEALGSVEADDQEPDTVVNVLQPGYHWGEGLLRPARVQVAR